MVPFEPGNSWDQEVSDHARRVSALLEYEDHMARRARPAAITGIESQLIVIQAP